MDQTRKTGLRTSRFRLNAQSVTGPGTTRKTTFRPAIIPTLFLAANATVGAKCRFFTGFVSGCAEPGPDFGAYFPLDRPVVGRLSSSTSLGPTVNVGEYFVLGAEYIAAWLSLAISFQ